MKAHIWVPCSECGECLGCHVSGTADQCEVRIVEQTCTCDPYWEDIWEEAKAFLEEGAE